MLALLVNSVAADTITLDKSPYHAVFADTPQLCINARDVHRLTGKFDVALGGTLAVHVDNGTLPDYTMTIGPPAPTTGSYAPRNVTATLKCKGETINVNGTANILVEKPEPPSFVSFDFRTSAHTTGAIFEKGVNPPPPPPPPPSCATTGKANQSACDAVKPAQGPGPACSWCESKDVRLAAAPTPD